MAKISVPETIKALVSEQAEEVIESTLKPKFIEPPPTDHDFNYIANIYTKWYRHYFYFCTTYNCPSPDSISPTFESKFARMEYIGNNRFNLSYMRHNEQWLELYRNLLLDECLTLVAEDGYFAP